MSDWAALAALCLSVFTLFWVHLRGPDFVCAPVRFIRVEAHTAGKHAIALPLAVSNIGGATGVIDYVYLQLIPSPSRQDTLSYWSKWQERDAVNLDKQIEWTELALPFALEPAATVQRLLCFVPDRDDPALASNTGTYQLRVLAKLAGRDEPHLLQARDITIGQLPPEGKYLVKGKLREVDTILIDWEEESPGGT